MTYVRTAFAFAFAFFQFDRRVILWSFCLLTFCLIFHVWQGAGEILGDIIEAMSQAGPAAVRTQSAAVIETIYPPHRTNLDDVHISLTRRTTARGRAWRTCSGSSRSCS